MPVAKLVNGERYSIVSDYIGRPVQVYNDAGEIVWETKYDIYGRLKKLKGDRAFQPFRQVGQYEDVELDGLYYNRFRVYDSNTGLYISQDPIRLKGGMALYGYVHDTNGWIDVFGLFPGVGFFSELKGSGMGHHPIPRGHANAHGLPNLGTHYDSPSWYPNETKGSNVLHHDLHKALQDNGVPFSGEFKGSQSELLTKIRAAYAGFDQKGYLKIPSTGEIIASAASRIL